MKYKEPTILPIPQPNTERVFFLFSDFPQLLNTPIQTLHCNASPQIIAHTKNLAYICLTKPNQDSSTNLLPIMSTLALQLIQKAHEQKATVLDLGNCGLRELPPELFELVCLEELYLCNRYADYEKGKWIESENKGEPNILDKIPEGFLQLKALTKLYLNGDYSNRWNIQKLENLDALQNLSSFYIRYNQITKIQKVEWLQFHIYMSIKI